MQLGDDLEVVVERRAVKRINIYVRPPHGEVFVTCPKRVSVRELRRVLTEREAWMRAARARVRKKHMHSLALEEAIARGDGIDGHSLPYLGKLWTVELESGGKPSYSLDAERQVIRLTLPAALDKDAQAQAQATLIRKLYKDTLAEHLPASLTRWEQKLGVRAQHITFRDMTTRWGSCQTRTGRLTFNIRLARYDLQYFDSVVLHELVHLRVPNHGPDFYRLMDQCLPEWQRLRRELRQLPF